MPKIIKSTIEIERPIVFLCGPYFDPENKSDRRKIMQDFFHEFFNAKLLPLVIDNFLAQENIEEDDINIQLLEEIFAEISSKTYIFLDTMSSAAELGLFSNNMAVNKIQVFLPEPSDVIQRNVGAFIQDIVLAHNGKRITFNYYRPKVSRVAIATDYVIEHYGFINDIMPDQLSTIIQNDEDLKNLSIDITFIKEDISGADCGKIKFQIDSEELCLTLHIRLIFYLVIALVDNEYGKNLTTKKIKKFRDLNVDNIISELKVSLLNLFTHRNFSETLNLKSIKINTKLNYSVEQIVKHIMQFIFLYHQKGRFHGYNLIENTNAILLDKGRELKSNPIVFFNLKKEEIETIKQINREPEKYFEELLMLRNRKKRTFYKYVNCDSKNKARAIHEKLVKRIKNKYTFSKSSFAYKEGCSIKDCVNKHLDNNHFIKIDIKNFFNSISVKILSDEIINQFNFDPIYRNTLNTIISSCFYKESVPLGLVTSPLLSDIYMKTIDEAIENHITNKNIMYTRYADDILFSKKEDFTKEEHDDLLKLLTGLLMKKKLVINQNKYKEIHLIQTGQHIKYLGVNIVKYQNNNKMTVGKKYINYVAKQYLRYLNMNADTDEEKETRFYKKNEVAGQVSFIQQIEGEYGFKKITNRIDKSTNGRIIIKSNKLPM